MSGRGLGFTGGTVDKLESIPGYNTNISVEDFIQNVKENGISLIGQTLNLAPADKKIYALRDAIGCVDNMNLIASSIMSKKVASGANKLVLDITVGSGAFMQNKKDAKKLAFTMKKIGELANKETVCILTSMEEPLGKSVGNILEIKEVVEALNGKMEEDVQDVITTMGSYMIKLAGKGDNLEDNKKKILKQIENRQAYQKFLELVYNQGGDTNYIKEVSCFEKAKYIVGIPSIKTGYVETADARKIGELSVKLGAGRLKKEDSIDYSAGIFINKKIGDFVKTGEILGYIHTNKENILEEAKQELLDAYKISEKKINKPKTIIEII